MSVYKPQSNISAQNPYGDTPTPTVRTNPIMQYFQYTHLPPNLRDISKRISDTANYMDNSLPDGPEKSAGLRKLLEAKDCFVRANL